MLAASYVDDFRFLIQMLDEGTRWDGGKLVWNPECELEDISSGESRERITAREVCKLMNSLCRDIQMTVEIEEDFLSGFIPTLDTQVKLDKALGKISYKFYSKPMATKFCLIEKSAIPITVRGSTLAQEVLRRQLNCSGDIGVEERISILEEFSSKMRLSGYSKLQRRDAMIAGLVGYSNRVSREASLGIALHREGASGKALRRLDKLTAKATWFKRPRTEQDLPNTQECPTSSPPKRMRTHVSQPGATTGRVPDTVMFVPKTRGGALATNLKIREKELSPYLNTNMRIMEEGGPN